MTISHDVTSIGDELRRIVSVDDTGEVELRRLAFAAPTDDLETRRNLFEVIKNRLDLPDNVKRLKIELDVHAPTSIYVEYYHFAKDCKRAGEIP